MVMLVDNLEPAITELTDEPTAPARSPEQWITYLWKRLDARIERIKLFDDYYAGRQRLRFTTIQMRETFGRDFGGFADNFCVLVVDAIEERLRITGFRVLGEAQPSRQTLFNRVRRLLPLPAAPETPEEGAPEAPPITNDELWRVWRANDMEAASSMAHNAALVGECAYVIVWPNPDDPATPYISTESPFQVITDEGRDRQAALKRWIDESDNHWRAELYLRDGLYKYRSRLTSRQAKDTSRPNFWEQWQDEGDTGWPLDNKLGEVPVVPLPNSPRLGPGQAAVSELAPVVDIQDAINKMVSGTLIAAEFVAYPQRVMINVSLPTDENNQPIEPFKAGANRVWFVQSPEGNNTVLNPSITQFPAADFGPYVNVIEMLVQHIASITKTPPHYLLGQSGAFPSGESLKATETGLVAKAVRKQRVFGDGWEEVMGLVFRWQKQAGIAVPTVNEEDIQVQWADPESRTEAQHIDALMKLSTIGIPNEQLWLDAGYTPQDVERFKALKDSQPTPPVPPPPAIPTDQPAAPTAPMMPINGSG